MTYIYWNPSPVIIDLGFYELRWYSFLFALGFVFSYAVLNAKFKEAGVGEKLLDKLAIYIVVATVVGARLGHCLFYDWEYYSNHVLEIFVPFRIHPEFEFTGFQGLASHGGILAIVVAVMLFALRYNIKALWLFDKLSIVGALAGACIRFGNLMNSEIIGTPTGVPWAFVFEKIDPLPRHPGQLYEAIAYSLIFVLLLIVEKKTNRKAGFIFGLFLVLLFLTRFMLEFFKVDQSAFESSMLLNMGQLLSIPFILVGLVIILMNLGKKPYIDKAQQAAL